MYLPYGLTIAVLGIYPREMKTYVHTKKKPVQKYSQPLFLLAKNWKQPKCPSMGGFQGNYAKGGKKSLIACCMIPFTEQSRLNKSIDRENR